MNKHTNITHTHIRTNVCYCISYANASVVSILSQHLILSSYQVNIVTFYNLLQYSNPPNLFIFILQSILFVNCVIGRISSMLATKESLEIGIEENAIRINFLTNAAKVIPLRIHSTEVIHRGNEVLEEPQK